MALWVLAAAPSSRSPSTASKPEDVRAKVEGYLAAHDVADSDQLRVLVAEPGKPLMAIVTDARVKGLLRARAAAALRLVPTPEIHTFLEKLVQAKAKASDATDRLIVRRAAVALGWMAGPRTQDQLALLFENADEEVRLDGVIAIALTRAATAATLLRKQRAAETSPRVRDQIDRQLRTLEPVPPQAQDPAPRKLQPPMRGGF
jgi:HEAT repeat protein